MGKKRESPTESAAEFGIGKLTRHLFVCLGPDCVDPEEGDRNRGDEDIRGGSDESIRGIADEADEEDEDFESTDDTEDDENDDGR